jgi:hypothetical protein
VSSKSGREQKLSELTKIPGSLGRSGSQASPAPLRLSLGGLSLFSCWSRRHFFLTGTTRHENDTGTRATHGMATGQGKGGMRGEGGDGQRRRRTKSKRKRKKQRRRGGV